MSKIAKYSAIALPGLNQMAKIKPDDGGYFPIILGGFNISNHGGVFYPLVESVKRMFDTGGIFRRRLDSGLLRGEFGHPDVSKMSLPDALNRLARVEPLLTSHHIRSVELIEKKDETGKPIILALGMVKPSGPYADCLQKQLANPEENVAFSIRSFTDTQSMGGRVVKIVTDILTYDYVTEPGIKNATQFTTAALEELLYSMEVSEQLLSQAISAPRLAGLEHEKNTLTMVKTNLGWNKVKVVDLRAINF